MAHRFRSASRLLLVSLLAGCTGLPVHSLPTVTSGVPGTNIVMRMVIAGPHRLRGHKRGARFVSPSTNGVLLDVYPHQKPHTPANLIVQVAVDVASGSPACGGKTGFPRTCTAAFDAPPTRATPDDFVVSTYDAIPSSGRFSSAHLLGYGTLTSQKVRAGHKNSYTVFLGGVIDGLSGTASDVSLAADGTAHTLGIAIDPVDFDNNAITAGTNDPFANPISVTVSESGGGGHAKVSLNGGTPSTTITVSRSTDAVELQYDGGGTPGYGAAVTLTAGQVQGTGGATETFAMTPLFVTNPTIFYSAAPAKLNMYPAQQLVLAVSEAASPAPTYNVTPAGCSGIIAPGTIVGSGASASLLLVAGTTTSTSGCSIAIDDGTSTFTIPAENTIRTLTGTPSVTDYAAASNISYPAGIAAGSDGNLWFAEQCTPAISKISTSGTGYTQHNLMSNGFQVPWGVTLGPDNLIWFGDNAGSRVGTVTPSGTIAVYEKQHSSATNFFAPRLDGKISFPEFYGDLVGTLDPAGGTAQTPTEISTPNSPQSAGLGPDLSVWYTDWGAQKIGRVSGGTASDFSSGTAGKPFQVTAGSDGRAWFTEQQSVSTETIIGAMTASGTLSEYPNTTGIAGSQAQYEVIVAGPDGRMWFADSGNNAIDAITTDGSTITMYTIPTSTSGPWGVTIGPDGNVWFTEDYTGRVGKVSLPGVAPAVKRP